MGFIGLAFSGKIEGFLQQHLLTAVSVDKMYGQWLLSIELVSFILFVGVAAVGVYSYILDNPTGRKKGKNLLETLVKILILSSGSFLIYSFLTGYSALLSQFIIVNAPGNGFSSVFPVFSTQSIEPVKLLTSDLSGEVVWSFLLRGLYTTGAILLGLTLAVRNILVLVGTGLFPLGITLRLLPFSYGKRLGGKLLSLPLTAVVLQVLDVFILSTVLVIDVSLFTHVAVFWTAAVINYGLLKQSLSNSFLTGYQGLIGKKRRNSFQRKSNSIYRSAKHRKSSGPGEKHGDTGTKQYQRTRRGGGGGGRRGLQSSR